MEERRREVIGSLRDLSAEAARVADVLEGGGTANPGRLVDLLYGVESLLIEEMRTDRPEPGGIELGEGVD